MLFLRHGRRKIKHNHQKNGIDTCLDPNFDGDFQKKIINLIAVYGIPDFIHTSPYLRTRETAEKILKIVHKFKIDQGIISRNIEVRVDIELREYLHSNYKNKNIGISSFDKMTLEYGFHLFEDEKNYEMRMKNILIKKAPSVRMRL